MPLNVIFAGGCTLKWPLRFYGEHVRPQGFQCTEEGSRALQAIDWLSSES